MPGRGRGRPPHPSLLTPAQQRVLEELRRGGTNAEIAVRLGLSPETVKTHIASMLSKLELGDRRELAAWQPQQGSARRRLLGALGVPSMLFLLKRPLVWAGAGLAGATAIAVVAIFIVWMPTTGGQPAPTAPVCSDPAEAAPAPSRIIILGTPTPEPGTIVVSDGSPDALLVEWAGGSGNATRWQYRLRRLEAGRPLPWQAWTDVPDSLPDTRCHRVTGLQEDTAYAFEVRGVVGPPGVAEAYEVFPTTEAGATQRRGELPVLQADRIAQGDGGTEWVVADFAITIPAGMRVTTVAPETPGAFEATVRVVESASGSILQFTESGALVEWTVDSPAAIRLEQQRYGRDIFDRVTPLSPDVNARFEQIVASVRPLAPTAATWEPGAKGPQVPALLVFSDGSPDALWIEWRKAGEDVTGWQYRARAWDGGASSSWSDWTDIPQAAATARRYRVTGLQHEDTWYEFQVRPLRGAVPGAAIEGGDVGGGAATNSRGRLPYLLQRMVAEGDGSTEWRPFGNFLVTIPAGMQVLGRGHGGGHLGPFSTLTDLATGSVLLFHYSGEEWSRTVRAPQVNDLFDQITASLRSCQPLCTEPGTLLAFSDGAPDALLLDWGRADRGRQEWSAPGGLTGWQYRVRLYRLSPGGWSDWTDFPGSNGASRRGRVPGLRPGTMYQFEVRAVAGPYAGEASARTRGLTQSASGPRLIQPDSVVVGDGRTEWRLPGGLIVVTIPAGMLVEGDRGFLSDLDSGSSLLLDLTTGVESRREMRNADEGGRDVNALFDQIVESVRVVGPR